MAYQQSDYGEQDLVLPSYVNTFRCRYCNNPLGSLDYENQKVFLCDRCGWWHFDKAVVDVIAPDYKTYHYYFGRGIVKEYDVSALDAPLDDLRRHLRIHPEHLAHTHPTRFEQLMASVLKSAYPSSSVQHVGRVGDGGIDIVLAVADDLQYLVQVKRRSLMDRNEGIKVIRELNGVLFREGKAKGMVISTARGFSRGVYDEIELARKSQKHYEMVLISYPNVVKMLDLSIADPYEPWTLLIDSLRSKWS
jgi:hypothetical protein